MVPRTRTEAAVPIPRRRFTIDEYHRMGEAGVFTEDDRVELLDGEILQMTPIGVPHASCVDRLTALFTRRLRDRAIVRVQNPIILNRWSEPQPYARTEVREVWLLDVVARVLEVYRRPALRGYRQEQRFVPGQALSPLAFPRLRFRVNELLGKR